MSSQRPGSSREVTQRPRERRGVAAAPRTGGACVVGTVSPDPRGDDAAGAGFLVGGIGLAAGVDAMRTFATTSEDFAVQKVASRGTFAFGGPP